MIMINHYDYRDQERNDADGAAERKKWIEIFETDRVHSGRNDHGLEADIRDQWRRRVAIDRHMPVAMRSRARDEERLAIGVDFQLCAM